MKEEFMADAFECYKASLAFQGIHLEDYTHDQLWTMFKKYNQNLVDDTIQKEYCFRLPEDSKH